MPANAEPTETGKRSLTGVWVERRVRQTVTMKCEHCGRPAMRRWIICKRCWKIFVGEE